MQRPLIVGVGGASGSGKTTLCHALRYRFGSEYSAVVEMDRYYHDLGHVPPAERGARDFDSPDALDVALLVDQLACLSRGDSVWVPEYDLVSHTRIAPGKWVEPPPVLFVEGIFCLVYAELRRLLTWSIFVSTPDPVCLERRLARDVGERGRTREDVLAQYARYVRPAADRVVRPSAAHARCVVNGTRPVDLLCDEITAALVNVRVPAVA